MKFKCGPTSAEVASVSTATSESIAMTNSPTPPATLDEQIEWMRVEAQYYKGSPRPAILASLEELKALRASPALDARKDGVDALLAELRDDFINIVVGGCTCGTKPPDPALHELNCHYRMAEAGLARIAAYQASPAQGDGRQGELSRLIERTVFDAYREGYMQGNEVSVRYEYESRVAHAEGRACAYYDARRERLERAFAPAATAAGDTHNPD